MNNIVDFSAKKKKEVYRKHAYEFAAAPAGVVSDLNEAEKLEVAGTLDLQNKIITSLLEYSDTYSLSQENIAIMIKVLNALSTHLIKDGCAMHGDEFANYIKTMLQRDQDDL